MANVLRFILVADDQMSRAFDKAARSTDRLSAAVERNNKALAGSNAASAASGVAALVGPADSAAQATDKLSNAVDNNNKAQARSKKSTAATASNLVALTGHVTGLGDAFNACNPKASMFVRIMGGIGAATGVLEPAVSALVVATGALGASLASAGIGLGAYGAALMPVMNRIKELLKLNEDVGAGVPGALEKMNTVLAHTDPMITRVTSQVFSAKDAWNSWGLSLAKWTLLPVGTALTAVNPLLRQMTPFVIEASLALNDLADKMVRAVKGTGFKEFLATMLPLVRPSIVGIGEAVGNIVAGLGNILQAFAPFSKGLVKGLVDITQRFQDWSDTLTHHSGFKAMITQWRTVWPEMRKALLLLLQILTNILKAWASMASPGNTKALWFALNPILAVTAALSSHPALIQLFTYMYLAAKVAGPLGALFTTLKSGWGGLSKFLALVTGGKVQLGMQGAGDTMLVAARQMQVAADTMLAASKGGIGGVAGKAGKGAAGAEAAGGGAAAAAGSRMSMLAKGGVIAGGALLAAGIAQYWKDAWDAGLKGSWQPVVDHIKQFMGGIPGILMSAGDGLLSALSKKGGGLLGKIPLFGPAFAQVAKYFQDIKASVNTWAAPTRNWLSQTGTSIYQGFLSGVKTTWTGSVQPWLASRGSAIVSSFGQLGQILAPAGHAIMSGFHSGAILHWASTIAPWLINTPGRALAAIPDLAGTLLGKGQSLINGLHLGGVQHWAAVIAPWLINTPGRALAAIPDLAGTLLGKGQSLISGLHSGITNFWNTTASPWLSGVGSRAAGLVGDLIGVLPGHGQSLTSGLHNGITSFWNGTVQPWLSGVGSRALSSIGNVLGSLVPGGTSLMQGLGDGITQRWGSIGTWLGGIGGRALAAVGNVLTALGSAGQNLIQGLWDGMQQKWGSVSTWLGSLKAAAGVLKGPESADLQALVANGIALIQGLHNGMKQQWPAIESWLGSLKSVIQGQGAGDVSTLVSSGVSIMQGLWNGLQQQWPAIQSWLGGLKNVIASVKGPLSADLQLLVDHGLAIMQGLLDGLKNGFAGGVQPYLQQIGGWIQEAASKFMPQIQSLLSSPGTLMSKISQYLPQAKSLIQQYLPQVQQILGGTGVGSLLAKAQQFLPPQAKAAVQRATAPKARPPARRAKPGPYRVPGGQKFFPAGSKMSHLPDDVAAFNDGFATSKQDDADQGFGPAQRWLRTTTLSHQRTPNTPAVVRAFNDGWADAKKDDASQGFKSAQRWLATNKFARGGTLREPVAGVGLRTGRGYMLGEAGAEAVSSQADLQDVAALLRALLGELRAIRHLASTQPERTGQAMGAVLNGSARRVALSRG